MWKTRLVLAASGLLLLTSGNSPAQADEPIGRFSLTPVGSFFLRLDSATGAMSMCGPKDGDYVCETIRDDALALKRQIDHLAGENEAMRLKILSLEAALQAAKAENKAKDAPPPSAAVELPKLDLDQVTALASKIMQRFEEIVRSLKQQEASKEL
jgi:hypothetical protein